MDAAGFLHVVTNSPDYRGQVSGARRLAARPARYGQVQPPLPVALTDALRADGIEQLYIHQAQAIEAVRAGRHVVVVTGTASGKTLCYNVPVLETFLSDPRARALYLFPTKALAQDQLKTLRRYDERIPGLALDAGTYDGDTPQSRRRALREMARIILTNPDMLHSGILPFHSRWAHFFASLRYVVVDELHTYRGIFGSNVALLLRRLRRVCKHYGTEPIFICSSATIGNPKEHAEALTGLSMTVVDDDGSPCGAKYFVLWNPPVIDQSLGLRRSASQEAQRLMTTLIANYQAPTIAFVRARRTAELLYRYVRESLEKQAPRLAAKVRSYRGGYLPEERRELERMLFSGELVGVTSTNALELGIDIGTLEACLIVGYPGTIASTWQQAGRAGRKSDESLAVLIASSQPVDQYIVTHPEYFFGQRHEDAITDPNNPFVLAAHLRCALQELPLDASDMEYFGPDTPGIVRILADVGEATEIRGRWYWSGPGYPAGDINLRNADPNNYTIEDVTSGKPRVLGTTDEWNAFTNLHTEAVYLHEGETYFVENLDLERRVARVRAQETDYFTVGVERSEIRVLAREEAWTEQPAERWQKGLGPAQVTSLVYMFRKIKFYSFDSLGFGSLNLPPHELYTEAAYVAPPKSLLHALRQAGLQPEEGMLGAANAIAGVLPALIMCDPADIGAVKDSANLGTPAIFIYDRFEGGVGYARRVFERMDEVLAAALELVENCPCANGCPSCVGAPEPVPLPEDIDTRGAMPDKAAALAVLRGMVRGEYPKPMLTRVEEAAPVTIETAPKAEFPEAKHTLGPAAPLPEGRLPAHVEEEIRKRLARWRVDRRHPRPG